MQAIPPGRTDSQSAAVGVGRVIADFIRAPRLLDLGGVSPALLDAAGAREVVPEVGDAGVDVAVAFEQDGRLEAVAGGLARAAASRIPAFVTLPVHGDAQSLPGTDAFLALAAEAGYREAARHRVSSRLMLFILFPAAGPAAAHWQSEDVRRLLDRINTRHARAGGQYAGDFASAGWTPSPKWAERAEWVARLIQPGLRILDVGCGAMDLERFVNASAYLPADAGMRDQRTRIIDLNERVVPGDWLAEADLVTFLGVFEYIDDPFRQLAAVAAAGRPVVLTYMIAEARTEKNRSLSLWVNDFSDADVLDMLQRAGFATVADLAYPGGKQRVYLAAPGGLVSSAGRWFRQPPEPAAG